MKRLITTLMLALGISSLQADCCPQMNCMPDFNYCCDMGFNVYGDLLYWRYCSDGYEWLREERSETVGNATQTSIKRHDLRFSWRPGVRLGLESEVDCYGWNVFGEWTWYYASKNDKTSPHIPTSATGTNTLGTPRPLSPPYQLATANNPTTSTARAHGDFIYQRFDVGMHKSCCVCEGLKVRPYAAFTYLHTHDHLSIRIDSTDTVNNPDNLRDNYRTFHDGVGSDVGVRMDWVICGEASLHTDMGLTALWDHRNVRFSRNRQINAAVSQVFDCHQNWCGYFLPHINLGFDYNDCYCGYMYNIHFGWEYVSLFDQTFFQLQYTDQASLQGFYAGFGVSF